MKAKKLICFLALPLMLVAWVGCSKDNAEEKKTDSLKVSESEKKKDESIDKEADKLYKEKEDLLAEKKAKEDSNNKVVKEDSNDKVVKEDSNDKVVKEDSNDKLVEDAVIKEGRTLAEERAYIDKQLNKENNQTLSLKQYQEKVESASKGISNAVQDTKLLFEKDKTFKSTQHELTIKLVFFKEKVKDLESIEPPKDYDYYRTQLRDDSKVIKQTVDQVLIGFNDGDIEKSQENLRAMLGYLDYLTLTLNEIKDAQN